MDLSSVKIFRGYIRILEREIEEQLGSETGCCGVTLSQCHILIELEKNSQNEISIKDLSEILELDKSTLSRSIENMVNKGWVNRIENKNDRRFTSLQLTREGIKIVDGINDRCNEYYLELLNNIPEEKLSMITGGIEYLAQAMRNMRKSSKKNNSCC